jgi:hypothetical protein
MPNTVDITVRARNEADKAFKEMNESLGKALKNMGQMAIAAAPQLFGPIIAGAGATAAAFASAGLATAAFGAAAMPQLTSVKKASEAYTKVLTAQDKAARMNADAHALAAKGGKEYTAALSKAKSANFAAKDAQDAYNQSLGHMPKATADTAVAFAKLKDSFQKWSNSLAPTTMPIFTKGLNTIRGLLPALTPLVQTASGAFTSMMDSLGKGVKGNGFKSFMLDMNVAAQRTLPDFLHSLGNIGGGLAGILQAFAPFSVQLTGGLESITAKFKDWGQSLKGSTGFNTWMASVEDKIPGVVGMLEDLAQTAMKLGSAFAPFSAIALTVVEALAGMVAAIPQGALDWLVPTLAGAAVAMRAFGVASAFTAGSIALINVTPIGAVVIALGALIGALIATGNANDMLDASFGRMGDGAQSATDKLINTAEGVGGAALNVVKWIDNLGGLMPNMTGATDAASASMGDFATGADFASTKVGEFTDKLKEAANAALELSGTQISFETAIDAASAAIKHNGKTLDIHTAAGRANATALNNIASSALRMGDKMTAAGQDSSVAMNRARAAFINAAVGAGRSRAAAAALADQYGLLAHAVNAVPGKKDIHVSSYTQQAMSGIWSVRAALAALHDKTITVSVVHGTADAAMATKASGGIVGHASEGGPRNGMTWVGEQGPELVNLAPGSTVHSAGDSQRISALSHKKPKPPPAYYGKVAAVALKQFIDSIDEQISHIKTKFNAVISIIKQKFNGAEEDSLVAYAKKNLAALEKLAAKRDAVAKKIADAKAFAQGIAKTATDWASLTNLGGANTAVGIKINLEGRLASLRAFASALKSLARRGLSKNLIQQIAEAGPEAGLQLAQDFMTMDPQMLKSVNSIQSQINKAAGQVGTNTSEALFGVKGLEKQEAGFQRAMDKAADKFAEKIAKALSNLSKHKGKASGGIAGGMTWVGEQGPELLNLPYGSSVMSAGDSRRRASSSGGSNQPIQVNLIVDGKTLASAMFDPLRGVIRSVAGGGPNSVQAALS